jgi:hypothetical protein
LPRQKSCTGSIRQESASANPKDAQSVSPFHGNGELL